MQPKTPKLLEDVREAAAGRITKHRRIVDFRNVLTHGYDLIDHRIVWNEQHWGTKSLRGYDSLRYKAPRR